MNTIEFSNFPSVWDESITLKVITEKPPWKSTPVVPTKQPLVFSNFPTGWNENTNCHICKPRGIFLKHMIHKCSETNTTFYFDIHKRPVVICTPNNHLTEIESVKIGEMIEGIKKFCTMNNIREYKIGWNVSETSTKHFHIKIHINRNKVKQMLKNHFCV